MPFGSVLSDTLASRSATLKLTRNFKFNPAVVNVVPLVNVLFLVLIFFALSSRFVLQPGLAVSLPSSQFALAPQKNAHIVSVTSAPTAGVYYRGEKINVADFGARLAAGRTQDRSLIIKADRHTPFDLVVQIMNEGLKHGFSLILATNPEE